jgi:hypothetical protein
MGGAFLALPERERLNAIKILALERNEGLISEDPLAEEGFDGVSSNFLARYKHKLARLSSVFLTLNHPCLLLPLAPQPEESCTVERNTPGSASPNAPVETDDEATRFASTLVFDVCVSDPFVPRLDLVETLGAFGDIPDDARQRE